MYWFSRVFAIDRQVDGMRGVESLRRRSFSGSGMFVWRSYCCVSRLSSSSSRRPFIWEALRTSSGLRRRRRGRRRRGQQSDRTAMRRHQQTVTLRPRCNGPILRHRSSPIWAYSLSWTWQRSSPTHPRHSTTAIKYNNYCTLLHVYWRACPIAMTVLYYESKTGFRAPFCQMLADPDEIWQRSVVAPFARIIACSVWPQSVHGRLQAIRKRRRFL